VELHLPPELQTKLARLAAQRRAPETLAREAVERFVDYDEWFAGEVEKGLASIERGATLTHEEVGVRLEALLEKHSRG
jgi:predicted transcriptional regulator